MNFENIYHEETLGPKALRPTFNRLQKGIITFILTLFIVCAYNVAKYFIALNNRLIVQSQFEQIEVQEFKQLDREFLKKESYSYLNVNKSFGNIELYRAEELSKKELRQLILNSLPNKKLVKRAKPYVAYALELSQRYQVDPFWVLSIMWTESHFNARARSHVGAIGPMQIMPLTAESISFQMKRKSTFQNLKMLPAKPLMNIEMGIFYLKKLHDQFDQNYRLATIAYNMGPARVRMRLRNNLPVGLRNHYLNKVYNAYNVLTKNYKIVMKNKLQPFEKTYVVQRSFKPNFSYQSINQFFLDIPASFVIAKNFTNPKISMSFSEGPIIL